MHSSPIIREDSQAARKLAQIKAAELQLQIEELEANHADYAKISRLRDLQYEICPGYFHVKDTSRLPERKKFYPDISLIPGKYHSINLIIIKSFALVLIIMTALFLFS